MTADDEEAALLRTGALPAAALLDALFADASVGMGFWDADLRCRRVNERLAAINGVPAEHHVGRRPSEVLPGLGAQLEGLLRQVLETGTALRDVALEGETPAAPGVTRHWLADYLPVSDPRSGVVGVGALVLEVTAERLANVRADRALARTSLIDAELRALYAALPVGVAFLDPELRYQRVNETLAQLNGRSVEEHRGAPIEEVLGPHAALVREALRQVLEERESLDLEVSVPLPRDPADVRALEATYFPVAEPDGRLLGVGGVVRDVTERKRLETEQSRLLREALYARAQAEAAGVRADAAREEAERSRADAERGRARAALLAQAGRRMAESMDWETALEAVVRSVVPVVADWCSLTVVEPGGRLRTVALAHADPERERIAWELVERYPPTLDQPSGPGRVIRTGDVEVLTDIEPATTGEPDGRRLVARLGARHAVVVPLKTPRGVIGAMAFVLGDSGRRFADEDVQLVRSLTARAALHIENARLYTERSTIAHALQMSLLPRALPSIPGAELAARYLPAGEQNVVGGDFYDVFRSGDDVWTAVVGDVSGKGAPAAALTALVRYTLHAAARLGQGPAADLALLDEELREDGPGHFCTLVNARICPAGGGFDVRLANAGHPSPLVLRADGTLELADGARGPLVGVLADAQFGEASMHLGPGDLLLLYTDGVTEVRTTDLDLGERELRATLGAEAGASAEEVVAAVARRAVELQRGAQRDDIALLAVKAVGAPALP